MAARVEVRASRSASSDRAFIRRFIADLDEELEQQRRSLIQEEETPTPARYAKRLAEQKAKRRQHIEALEKQRAQFAEELARLDGA